MTFAPPGILRHIPTGPNPLVTDYVQLLGPKLRAAWDVREGGFFAPGLWVSHTDLITSLKLTAPADAARPICVADGSNFRGQRVIRITTAGSLRMLAAAPNIIPPGTRPEVYAIARTNAFGGAGCLVGCADPTASSSAGAQLWRSASNTMIGAVGGDVVGSYSDTASVHLFDSYLDVDLTRKLLVDNAVLATVSPGLVTLPTTQVAVGGFATGFTASVDAYVAAWGIISPPMTDAERAQFYAIARNDWGF